MLSELSLKKMFYYFEARVHISGIQFSLFFNKVKSNRFYVSFALDIYIKGQDAVFAIRRKRRQQKKRNGLQGRTKD